MNEKIENKAGKYKLPFFLTFSVKILKRTNSKISSTILCQALGINLAFEQAALKSKKAKEQLNIVSSDEFVKDKSTSPKLMDTIFIIVNCSSGE